MPTKIVRLQRLPDGRLTTLERSDERLELARQHGGTVWDVTVEKAPFRREAERVLALSLERFDPFADDAGQRARARVAVKQVWPTSPTPDTGEA